MKKGLYTLFALMLVVSMGLAMVPAVAAHGGGGHEGGGHEGGGHGGWGSGHGMPSPTMPAPTMEPPCSNCQPTVTPTPEPHHGGEGHCGNCGHPTPMPTVSPLPTPHHGIEPHPQRHAEQHAMQHRHVMSGTMPLTRTMGIPGMMVQAIEEATGLTTEEIAAARAEGLSWNQIITENGSTVEEVVAILVEAKAARLQTFVDEGILSEAFVQQLLEMLAMRWEAILSQ